MSKRERLERAINNASSDRIPVAMWRLWPGDDQRSADLARAHLWFQEQFDWDFLVITAASNFSVTGYGLTDTWQGRASGLRDIIKPLIQRSLDWTDLRPLDPLRGDTGKQLECLRMVNSALGTADTPFLQIIHSPLGQARRLAGSDLLSQHMRTNPDRLHSGLNTLTESTLRLVDSLKRIEHLAGIVYVVEQADYQIMSEQEYLTFGLPYDRKILEMLPDQWWFNLAQIFGNAPMLDVIATLPVHAINWSVHASNVAFERQSVSFEGAICGGISASSDIVLGTPFTIRDTVRTLVDRNGRRGLILSSNNFVPLTTPLSNLRAVRDVVEMIAAGSGL